MATSIAGHFFALLIGLNLGSIGGGGSILTVPILVYILGQLKWRLRSSRRGASPLG